ncbi:MAG: spore germination protein, partial [Clostridiales bacterium]|nr:spore germination protein [Clostridiales bacterium]
QKTSAAILFIDEMVDAMIIDDFVIRPIVEYKSFFKQNADNLVDTLCENIISSKGLIRFEDRNKCTSLMLNGNAILIVNGAGEYVSIAVQGYQKRTVSEPPIQSVVRGPREGFIEDYKTNMSLIRKRLKTTDLIFDIMEVGKYSSTKVCVTYINSIAAPKIVEEVKRRIASIDIDGIIDSAYVTEFLGDKKNTIFQLVGVSEKPDVIAGKILEGRVAVIVDGSPDVLTVPFLFIENLQNASDYYSHSFRANYLRILRVLGLVLATLLPGIYVALQTFHYEMLPASFLLTIMNARESIPLNPVAEVIFVIVLFEILQEASVRMPRYIGAAISIVGGLVLGETAVSAGLVSSPGVMIPALSIIAIYTVPDQAGMLNVLQIVFVVLAGFCGFFGIALGAVILLLCLLGLTSMGVAYLSPYAPDISADRKRDGIFVRNITERFKRPSSIPNQNKTRMRKRGKEGGDE